MDGSLPTEMVGHSLDPIAENSQVSTIQSSMEYGAISRPPTKLQGALLKQPGSRKLFTVTNLDLNAQNIIGYDNPNFSPDEIVPPSPSPSVLSNANPVILPRKRKSSCIFPNYLRSSKSGDNLHLIAMESESTNNLAPYSTVNHESVPRLENYSRGIATTVRPTLDELHEPDKFEFNINSDLENKNVSENKVVKFGWFEGVFVRTCVNLLGVMLFMRMGWMAGQAGIIVALLQIILSTAITCLTTISMNALCTNGDIGAGGIYSMISRSLGPEAGAMIGIIFALTNAAFVGLNLIGAGEAVVQILEHFSINMTSDNVNDIRIVGIIFLFMIAIIPMISLAFEAKTQTVFLVILVICIFDYFIGVMIPPNISQQAKGFVGWHLYVGQENLWPKWAYGTNFFQVFGVFFPSVTPIFTGACMSGDLKNPAKAIPKGTFLSIAATSTTYMIFILFTGCTIVSYATGDIKDIGHMNATCDPSVCKFGLINDYQTVALSSGLSHLGLEIEPLIYIGILAASLSSALGCYMAAPRIFQSFAEDKLLPGIGWFAKGYGPENDPRRGYLLTFLVAAIFTLIGNLNLIAPYISNFYLISFFLVNITCFHADWVKTLSFRPSFKYFNKWLSLFSALICFGLMFLLDWQSAIFALVLMMAIWLYMVKQGPNVNWGTTSEAQLFNLAHSSALKLYFSEEHVKNYRPIVMVLTGNPSARPALVDMGANLTKEFGMLFLGHVKKAPITYKSRWAALAAQKMWLKMRNVKGFYVLSEGESLSDGCKRILPTTGLGKLRPNIIMLGYKTNWHDLVAKPSDVQEYFNVIHYALDMHLSLIIFRVQEGFDFSQYFPSVSLEVPDTQYVQANGKSRFDFSFVESLTSKMTQIMNNNEERKDIPEARRDSTVPTQIMKSVNQFQHKQKKGTVDVWWLYDTGGITLLIAWILRNTRNSLWYGCKLRVFSVTRTDIEAAKSNLTELLLKFRIPFSDVTVLNDISPPPSEESKSQFRDLIQDWMEENESGNSSSSNKITKYELNTLKHMTNRHLRLRELLLEYSQDATMIVMTLPMPRKDVCSAPLYMSWLEMLTQNMPPFILVRGNQLDVLTFYS